MYLIFERKSLFLNFTILIIKILIIIFFFTKIFEIVKVIWTVFSVSGWGINNSFLYYLYVIGLLILDTITIKALVNYLISLHKVNTNLK